MILRTLSNYTFVVHKNYTYYKTGGQVQHVCGTKSNTVHPDPEIREGPGHAGP